jgi:multidrug resistance efflux pump
MSDENSIHERIAVLEAMQKRNSEEINALFDFMREHAEKDEQQIAEVKNLIAQNNQTLTNAIIEVKGVVEKRKVFVGGVIFAVSGVVAFITFVINLMSKTQ